MAYINTETLAYPLTYEQVVALFPLTSFPPSEFFVAPAPFKAVTATPKITFNPVTQQLVEDAPKLVNGVWLQQWKTVDRQANQIERDAAIAAAAKVSALNIQASIISSVQSRLDTFAQTKSYDGILSACTYATSSVPKFMVEGQYAVIARDATWSAANSILEAVIAGTRPVPSGYAEIEPELPELVWPQ